MYSVIICVYFVSFCFILQLHSCCINVSVVGWGRPPSWIYGCLLLRGRGEGKVDGKVKEGGRGAGRGMGWGREERGRGGEGEGGERRGGEYCHFFLYTLSTV